MNSRMILVIILILFMLPSCRRVESPVRSNRQPVSELLARCFDIFIPVNAKSLQDQSPHSDNEMRAQLFVQYTISTASDQLQRRYVTEMERLGWQLLTMYAIAEASSDASYVLIFQKPESICCVIVDTTKPGQCRVRCMRSALQY